MNKIIKSTAVIAAAVVTATGVAQIAQADASSTVTIRQADLITSLSDTRSAGHVTFLNDGLHVMTDDATSQAKAAEYFAVSGALPTSASLTWFGTQPQPGQQMVFDIDADHTNAESYNVLVGEPIYTGGDWWLTKSSSATAKLAAPSCDGSPDVATDTSDNLIAAGHCTGGSGSAWHGTLGQWSDALPASSNLTAGGFSLGSGVKGDGVVESITYGDTTYTFTAAASAPVKTVADVTGHSTKTVSGAKVRLDLVSDAQPENTIRGHRLAWRVTVDGARVLSSSQGFGSHDIYVHTFAKHSGTHYVDLYKNGVKIRHFAVHTS